MLISTYLLRVKAAPPLRGHAPRPRRLPVLARPARRPRPGAALRRGAAPARADQRPVLPAHGTEPPGAAGHGRGRVAARHGPHDAHRRPEAAGAPRPPRRGARRRRSPQPAPGTDRARPRPPRARPARLGADAGRGGAPPRRPGPPSRRPACALLTASVVRFPTAWIGECRWLWDARFDALDQIAEE